MLNLLKSILWIFPGLLGLVWNPFERKGIKRLTLDDVWTITFSRRHGFSDSCYKRDIKQLWKDYKKYSKKQPKYLPKIIDVLHICNMNTRNNIEYMADTSWRRVFKDFDSGNHAYVRTWFLLFSPPENMILSEEFEGRYPSLSVNRNPYEDQVNKLIFQRVFLGICDEDLEKKIGEITGHEDYECLYCDNSHDTYFPGGKCPSCNWTQELPESTVKALNKVYDKYADKLVAESKAA